MRMYARRILYPESAATGRNGSFPVLWSQATLAGGPTRLGSIAKEPDPKP